MKTRQREILNEIEGFIESPEAIIITGMHRVGKTTCLDYLFENIDSENKLFIHLENPVSRKYFEIENYEDAKSTFEFLGIDLKERAYIFIDDIQYVRNLPSVVSYFIDKYKVKFFMVCSGSFYLTEKFNEFLPGRKHLFELEPLNFKEFLKFKDIKLVIPTDSKKVSKSIYDTIMPDYKEYLCFGGFPGVVLKSSSVQKKKALEEIFSSFYQLVTFQLGDQRNGSAIRDLMLALLNRIGTRLDIQKLSKELGISRPTLYRYLTFLKTTHFIFLITPLNRGKSSEIKKMPKVYVCDSGLANLFTRVDEKYLFENSVFQNLKKRGEVNYYNRKSGVKIDFIIDRRNAYDVKINPSVSDLKKLTSLTKDLACSSSNMIAKNYSNLNNVLYGFML